MLRWRQSDAFECMLLCNACAEGNGRCALDACSQNVTHEIRMKIIALVLVLLATIAPAQASSSRTSRSALIGKWAVDVSRLPTPLETRPRSVTIAFEESLDEKWTMSVDIVDAGGSLTHAGGTAALDGTPIAVEGPEADTAAFKLPEPDVLVLALAKGGVPASMRVYATGKDGKSMVETAVYFRKDGSPEMRTNYFTRIK